MNLMRGASLSLAVCTLLSACTKNPLRVTNDSRGQTEAAISPLKGAQKSDGGSPPINPNEVYIRNMTYNGSGCPASTVSHNISPDARAITLLFAEFTANIGPRHADEEARRNCQMDLEIHSPPGFHYRLVSLDVRGFAQLEDSVTADVKSTVYFQASPIAETFTTTLAGPTTDNYTSHSEQEFDDLVSPCEGEVRSLNINAETILDNSADPTKSGYMTVDSIDGELTHTYGIVWSECTTPVEPTPTPAPTVTPTPTTVPAPPSNGMRSNSLIAVGPGIGSNEPVRIFDTHDTSFPVALFRPFGYIYNGGYRVALADVNGDGAMDLIAGTDEGSQSRVVVISGSTYSTLLDFQPFSGTGGVYVAAGDTDADGKADIIVGAGKGNAPEAKVFNHSGTLLRTVQVYEPNYLGGVRVAVGNFNGDHMIDIATATPPGGGPRVKILNGVDLSTIRDDFVYEPEFRGGVWLSAADVDGDGRAELITGTDVGGGPRVRILNAETFQSKVPDFFAYDASFRTGVRVGAVDTNDDRRFELIVGAGTGSGPHIRVLNPATASPMIGDFWGADQNAREGFYVSGAVPNL